MQKQKKQTCVVHATRSCWMRDIQKQIKNRFDMVSEEASRHKNQTQTIF
jgi:hypothetical protein